MKVGVERIIIAIIVTSEVALAYHLVPMVSH
jgi:hypothetical protein